MPRPKMMPTEEQRRLVKSLSAYGITHEQIAQQVGIRSAKTLRKHFREELDRGAVEANANVAKTLYRLATSGTSPVSTIFWLKTRAGWKEVRAWEPAPVVPPPFIVAKEEGAPIP
jgi:hypothetical protein